jgi:hypothetical protein
MRTIGGSLGAQIAASIVATHVVVRTGLPDEAGFTEAFVLSAAVLVLAFLAALAIPRRPRPPLLDHSPGEPPGREQLATART